MSEKNNIIRCAANAARDCILEQIIENKRFEDIEDEGRYRHGFVRGFEEGINFMLGFRKHEKQMYRSLAGKVDFAKDGENDRHAGVVITAVQGDGKTNQKSVIEPCGESVSVAESLTKLKELSGLDEPVLKEGDIVVTNTDGWVSAQKAIEMKVGDFVILAENLNIDDGLGGIAVSDEHPEYGRYYTWDAAVRVARKIKGWHLPTAEEAIAMNNEAHKDPNPVIFPRTGYLLAGPTHNKFMESDLVFWTATDLIGILETPPEHDMARSLCVSEARSLCVSDRYARATAKRILFSVKLFKDKE